MAWAKAIQWCVLGPMLLIGTARMLNGGTVEETPPPGMVYVPAGFFIMGSDEDTDAERPRREVFVEAFFMDKCEVTNAQYLKFVRATRHAPPAAAEEPAIPGHNLWVRGKAPKEFMDLPVVNVTWDDAAAYAAWAGKRLPNEAEWEKAARGTDGRRYPWGNEFVKGYCNVEGKGAVRGGSFPHDESPFGCFDMAGNVAEWTADWFKPYPRGPEDTLYWEDCKVIRGGAWDYLVNSPRCAKRLPANPKVRSNYFGFRCAQSLPAGR
jgi:formylglycine-generating enzyme required for sulfatase activity